jgi:hypothetical protein
MAPPIIPAPITLILSVIGNHTLLLTSQHFTLKLLLYALSKKTYLSSGYKLLQQFLHGQGWSIRSYSSRIKVSWKSLKTAVTKNLEQCVNGRHWQG